MGSITSNEGVGLSRLDARLAETLEYLIEQYAISNSVENIGDARKQFSLNIRSDILLWLEEKACAGDQEQIDSILRPFANEGLSSEAGLAKLRKLFARSKSFFARPTNQGGFPEVKQVTAYYLLNSSDFNFDAFQGYRRISMPYPSDQFEAIPFPGEGEKNYFRMTRMSRIRAGEVSRSLMTIYTEKPEKGSGYFWRYTIEKNIKSDRNKPDMTTNKLVSRGIIQPNYNQIFFVGAERYSRVVDGKRLVINDGAQTMHFQDKRHDSERILGICTSAINFKTEPCSSIVFLEPLDDIHEAEYVEKNTGLENPELTKVEKSILNRFNTKWQMLICSDE